MLLPVESDKTFAEQARRLLEEMGVSNVAVVDGRLTGGVPAQGPYDAIVLNGAVAEIAPALLDQLKDGGLLAAILVDGPLSRAQVWRRGGKTFDARPAFDASAAVLPGFERPAAFVF